MRSEWLGARLRAVTAGLVAVGCLMMLGVGCGPSVTPISIHDEGLSPDDRRLLADSENSVAIAQTQHRNAVEELQQLEQWRNQVRAEGDWPDGATALVGTFEELLDARIALAELELELADERIELAERELELTTARIAVRNDRAVYDLEAVSSRVEDQREAIREMEREILEQNEVLRQTTARWWDNYSDFAQQGGEITPFYRAFDRPTPGR